MKIASVAGALLGLGALALTGTNPASAAIVCNGDSCWHTHTVYHYPPTAGVVVHSDHWSWGPHDHYAWHEHEGRGYWRGGVWVTF